MTRLTNFDSALPLLFWNFNLTHYRISLFCICAHLCNLWLVFFSVDSVPPCFDSRSVDTDLARRRVDAADGEEVVDAVAVGVAGVAAAGGAGLGGGCGVPAPAEGGVAVDLGLGGAFVFPRRPR